MKIIRYNIPAYTWVWNEKTQETKKQECLAEIEAPYSEAAYQKAQDEAVGEVTVEDVGSPLTPAEQREEAYNTDAIIEWDGGNITVTEAAQLWQYYSAEGNPKSYELTALIAKAKDEIREQHPDN